MFYPNSVREPEAWHLAVRDHGIGISAEQHALIFDRFYQVDASSRADGMGLGLFISRELVSRHGGSLIVESPQDGVGSRFVLSLPAHAPLQAHDVYLPMGDALIPFHAGGLRGAPAPPHPDTARDQTSCRPVVLA